MPEHLIPDRAAHPRATDAEWRAALAILDEAAGRAYPLSPLSVEVRHDLNPAQPCVVWWRTIAAGDQCSPSLYNLPQADRVQVSRPVFDILCDSAMRDLRPF